MEMREGQKSTSRSVWRAWVQDRLRHCWFKGGQPLVGVCESTTGQVGRLNNYTSKRGLTDDSNISKIEFLVVIPARYLPPQREESLAKLCGRNPLLASSLGLQLSRFQPL